jgi:ABC-type antimicrobial peptide transport system permease subunit
MGVRLALGATEWQLRAAVARRVVLPAAMAALGGMALAYFLRRCLESLYTGAAALRTADCACAAALLLLTVCAGAWFATFPLRRMEPIEVLRAE